MDSRLVSGSNRYQKMIAQYFLRGKKSDYQLHIYPLHPIKWSFKAGWEAFPSICEPEMLAGLLSAVFTVISP